MGRRNMGFRGFVFAATLIVGAAPGAAHAADWQKQSYADLGFSIDLPCTPQITKLDLASPVGPIPRTVGACIGETQQVYWSVADYRSIGGKPSPRQTLDASMHGGIAALGAIQDSVAKITVSGHPGRDFAFHTTELVGKARMIMVGRRVYQVLAVGPAGQGAPTMFDRAIQSWRPMAPGRGNLPRSAPRQGEHQAAAS